MSRIVFDLESDGLLYEATKIWCIATTDIDGNSDFFGPDEIHSGIDRLLNCDYLIGHNIAGFDIPLMEKLYDIQGIFDRSKIRDTYVMSKLMYPSRQSHSLDSWGRKLGIMKPEHEDWSQFSEEMERRCIEDVKINVKLYEYLIENQCKSWPQWSRSVVLEGEMHYWQAMQEEAGVGFDKEAAIALVAHLDEEIKKIEDQLDPILPVYCKQVGMEVKKPFKKNGEYIQRVEDWFASDAEK